jgi:hypothetical protein
MSYSDKRNKQLTETADAIAAALVGKTIASVRMPVKYPGNYESVEIITTTGEVLTLNEYSTSCNECDPEGIGNGVQVDFSIKKP